MLLKLEEISMNAWPALQTLLYDGWILRFADGYTRRANSIHLLYPSKIETSQKIKKCEEIYSGQGLPVKFQLAGRAESQEIDQLLEKQGYESEGETSMQSLDLIYARSSMIDDVQLDQQINDQWGELCARLHILNENHAKTHFKMMEAIIPSRCFATVSFQGKAVGCGLGVFEDGFLGIFDIIVDKDYRHQGYGNRLMQALISWGKAKGAHTAYLQVMLDNTPALRLYERLGFNEQYQYWYRVKAN
jgi:ribosomal protein S18 acetylase RimI-like enzyme